MRVFETELEAVLALQIGNALLRIGIRAGSDDLRPIVLRAKAIEALDGDVRETRRARQTRIDWVCDAGVKAGLGDGYTVIAKPDFVHDCRAGCVDPVLRVRPDLNRKRIEED